LEAWAEDWEDDMTTFITQARFTKEGFNAMIAAPEDRAEIVGRLIAEVGGKLIAYYLTSGEYDILLIFEGPSYEETVPALIVAAAESGVADLKTVTALTSSEMKSAFVKAGSIAASYRSADAHAATPSLAPQTGLPNSSSQREKEAASETQDNVKAATAILSAEKKAVEDIRAGSPAPYYFAPPVSAAPSQPATSPRSTNSADVKNVTSPTKGRRKGA
jgi:uncharacterized protein with GYD domain